MFLKSDFVFGNELCEKMGISLSNLINLRKQFENGDDHFTIYKLNSCSFINTKSHKIPNNFRTGLETHQLTDITDKLPLSWVQSEYGLTISKELQDIGIITDRITLAKKIFLVFDREFVNKLQGKIGYILKEKETFECLENGDIEGYLKIKRNKYFTWYSI